MCHNKNAYSLTELTMVLVILLLLITLIMSSLNMVKNSKLMAQAQQFSEVENALKSFKQFYGQWPGDYSRAADIWGADCEGGTGTDTCGGNGDGAIGSTTGLYDATNDPKSESIKAWQHLSKARLITGNFALTGTTFIPNSTVLNGKVKSSILRIVNYNVWQDGIKHIIKLSRYDSANNTTEYNPLSPRDAHALDIKFDDGLPYAGKMVAYNIEAASATCIVGSTHISTLTTIYPSADAYDLTTDTLYCHPVVIFEEN
jgi:type II secretory pathway pseudopilin PulG